MRKLLWLVVLMPSLAFAQGADLVELRGVLLDSIRGGVAVPHAEVALLGTGRTARTDVNGEFVFPGASRGRFVIAHWGPWLDSLQLPPLRIEVQVDSGVTPVVLSTPSYEKHFFARCGFAWSEGMAVLLGELRSIGGTDASSSVSARWTELVVRGPRVERSVRATVDTIATRTGVFALCGVPLGEVVSISVSGSVVAGPVLRLVDSRLATEDLIARARDSTLKEVIVLGRVLTEFGQPVEGATVEVLADSSPRSRTDQQGGFRAVTHGGGSRTLVVRGIGRLESFLPVHPAGDTISVGDIVLKEVPASMRAIVVRAEQLEREHEDFERRSRGANGHFISADMLAGIPIVTASALAAIVPRLGANGRTLALRRGMGFCSPRFFEDGIDVGRLDTIEMQQQQISLIERAKRVEVYTASQAPPRFNDNDGCGAVVVWTR